jgi:hypothetical protein
MKSPMNMAPNKMASPAKKMDPMYNGKAGVQQEDFEQFSAAKMKSPMKMGSAYKMDKSAFKLKSAPVNMNTPGSVAKLAGVSPMKNDLRKDLKKQGFKRTGESEVTRTLTDKEVKAYKAKKK